MSPSRIVVPFLATVAFAVSRVASAAECRSDADCSEGFHCEKSISSPGCANPPDCPPPEPVESETGDCVRSPLSCSTDADCPAFLECTDPERSCWANVDGGMGCDEPDPSQMTCHPKIIECAIDADCPASFACTELSDEACPTLACEPPGPCDDACERTTRNVCIPQEIACTSDAECPSDWTCETVETECDDEPPVAGGGGASGGGEDPASKSSGLCETKTACVPMFFDGYGGREYAESGSPTTANDGSGSTETAGDSSADDGGCAVHPLRSSGGTVGAFALLGLAASLLRRRKR